jgi:hypothetical protein
MCDYFFGILYHAFTTNCGKTSHTLETCHNKKKEVPIVLITIVKSIELVAKTKTQLVKPVKIHV